jgi:hypothetical protein
MYLGKSSSSSKHLQHGFPTPSQSTNWSSEENYVRNCIFSGVKTVSKWSAVMIRTSDSSNVKYSLSGSSGSASHVSLNFE